MLGGSFRLSYIILPPMQGLVARQESPHSCRFLTNGGGNPVAAGWVTKVDGDPCVVCPYHGWAFDGEGRVRDVPASENKVPSPPPAPLLLSLSAAADVIALFSAC